MLLTTVIQAPLIFDIFTITKVLVNTTILEPLVGDYVTRNTDSAITDMVQRETSAFPRSYKINT